MRVKGSSIMKKLISLISFVLVLVMLTSGATVFGAAFSDFPGKNHYGYAYGPACGWDGYPDGSFKPDNLVTRAEFVCYLYKYFKYSQLSEVLPEVKQIRKYNNSFSDVSPKNWYYDSVVWAYECGIINGTGKGKFDPGSTVTVFEYAIMMKRYYDAIKLKELEKFYVEESDGYEYLVTLTLDTFGSCYEPGLLSKDREAFWNNAVLTDLPRWFAKETSIKEIVDYDIWIGGGGKRLDMTKFKATRGEIYKHSKCFEIEGSNPS